MKMIQIEFRPINRLTLEECRGVDQQSSFGMWTRSLRVTSRNYTAFRR